MFSAGIVHPNSDSLVIHNKDFKITLSGNEGKFSENFNAPKGFYQLFDGVAFATLYLSPGFDLQLKADGNSFSETLSFSGIGAKENDFILGKKATDQKLIQNFGGQLPTSEDLQKVLDKRLLEAKNILSSSNFSSDFTNLMLAEYEVENHRITEELNTVKSKLNEVSSLKGIIAPEFNYANYSGGKTALTSLRGKYVYLDIWATWCAPCGAEIPYLKELEQKYKNQNIIFLSISVDKQKDYEKWLKFVSDEKLGGVQLFADKDFYSDWVKAFKVDSIPRFILIDPDGKVADPDALRPSSPELKIKLDKLLLPEAKARK
ncbi:MAG: TlpA family protein disulfide reductase [Chitinophagaceae bacterium]|nr:MAG: TlpA family protein disulfide reductase [Chitinophagaceae bacterium]